MLILPIVCAVWSTGRLDELVARADEAATVVQRGGHDAAAVEQLSESMTKLHHFNMHHFKHEEQVLVPMVETLYRQNENLRQMMQEMISTSEVS